MITPDFMYCAAGCNAIQKGTQIAGDILGLPMLYIDQPATDNRENYLEYVTAQLLDAIEWIEKRTGRKFDDERFIPSVSFNIQTNAFWAKISDLTMNVPSPMSARQAASLHTPLVTMAYSREVMEYLELLYDEMLQRVKEGISATPYERKRLCHAGGIHPMFRPDVLRWPERYGAAFVLGWGVWGGAYSEDGKRVMPKSLEERGIVLKNRADAIRAMLDPFGFGGRTEGNRGGMRRNQLRRLKDWHIDGVMLHLARRCALTQNQIFDQKRELEEAGFIVGTYEASEGDPNEWNETRITEDFERFFEQLGLTKLDYVESDKDED